MVTGWAKLEQDIVRSFKYTLEYLDEALVANGLI